MEDKPTTRTTAEIADEYLREEFGIGLGTIEEQFGETSTGSPLDDCRHDTVRAVEPNEVTAGLNVTRVDVDEEFEGMPFMVELEQNFPPEDNRAGESVAIHGEHAVLQTIAGLADIVSERFEEVPWNDV